MVHVPASGGQALQAHYSVIDGKTGTVQSRILNQDWGSNAWLFLGDFDFTAGQKIALSSYSPDGTADDTAWDAVAFVPVATPRYKVVALGDSYSSGEGITPFNANTATSDGRDSCHRSASAYSNLVTMPGASSPLGKDPNDELDFIACASSHTTTVSPKAYISGAENPPDSDWGSPYIVNGEEYQTLQGDLDSRTDAVLLSIGGNDIRFSDVLKTCAITGLGTGTCSASGYVRQGDPQPLVSYETHIIKDLLPAHLKATYQAIAAAAPNATIFVVGYPRLFPTSSTAQGQCPADMTIKPADQTWLNSAADLLTATTKSVVSGLAASGTKIHFVDPTTAFTGHDVCASTSTSYLNAIVGLPTSPGAGSFHPKASGQTAYAALVTSAMQTYLPKK